jgi:hypothetical protein
VLRYLIILVLFMHGVGHVLFLINSWGLSKTGADRSWPFSGILGVGQTVEGIFGLLWLVPLVGFVAVTLGYVGHQGGGRRRSEQSAMGAVSTKQQGWVQGWMRIEAGERLPEETHQVENPYSKGDLGYKL